MILPIPCETAESEHDSGVAMALRHTQIEVSRCNQLWYRTSFHNEVSSNKSDQAAQDRDADGP